VQINRRLVFDALRNFLKWGSLGLVVTIALSLSSQCGRPSDWWNSSLGKAEIVAGRILWPAVYFMPSINAGRRVVWTDQIGSFWEFYASNFVLYGGVAFAITLMGAKSGEKPGTS
jgi:hypothetical protein